MANEEKRVELSCVACKRLKRKCSRDRPRCTLCQRTKRRCQYPSQEPSNELSLVSQLKARIEELESNQQKHVDGDSLEIPTPVSNRSVTAPSPIGTAPITVSSSGNSKGSNMAMLFLDSVACRNREDQLWRPIEASLANTPSNPFTVTEMRHIVQLHVQTTHTWLPVISVIRLGKLIATATTSQMSLDNHLLLMSLRVMNQGDSYHDQSLYSAVKSGLSMCLTHSLLTLNILGALVMITAFEFGHAMFPAAYMSSAECSRLSHLFGFQDTRRAVQLLPKPNTWLEHEERRRLWWATIILDRCVTVGFRFRPLYTSFLPSHELLPADDDSWDRGDIAANPALIMSGDNQYHVAPFGRLCQASQLLGRVIQHVNYEYNVKESDSSMHQAEAMQLHRAASSFLVNIEDEYRQLTEDQRSKLSSTRAFALSTLLNLYDMHCCIEGDSIKVTDDATSARIDMQNISIQEQKRLSGNVVVFAKDISALATAERIHSISPLLCECLYQAAAYYAWHFRESANMASLNALNQLRGTLEVINLRWHVAGSYLQLLEKTEYEYTGGCRF